MPWAGSDLERLRVQATPQTLHPSPGWSTLRYHHRWGVARLVLKALGGQELCHSCHCHLLFLQSDFPTSCCSIRSFLPAPHEGGADAKIRKPWGARARRALSVLPSLTLSPPLGLPQPSLSPPSHQPNGKGWCCHHRQDITGRGRNKCSLLCPPRNVPSLFPISQEKSVHSRLWHVPKVGFPAAPGPRQTQPPSFSQST